MKMARRFKSEAGARGFIEGLKYVNDLDIRNIQLSYDPDEYIVRFDDDDVKEIDRDYELPNNGCEEIRCGGCPTETGCPYRPTEEAK
jgi:hypothetical protein